MEDIPTTTPHKSPETIDPPLPDLLNSSAYTKPYCRGERERPRSCIDPSKASFKLGEDITNISKKRWSGIALNSKLIQAYNRLEDTDEEYTDSLETHRREGGAPRVIIEGNTSNDEVPGLTEEPLSLDSNLSDEKPINGRRFKKLQQKWEMLSGKESISPPSSPTHSSKSKIPRPVISPVKPSGIPVAVSPSAKNGKGVKKIVTSPGGIKKAVVGAACATTGTAVRPPVTRKAIGNSR